MNVVLTFGAPEPRPPCVICGTPYEKHGTYPTCASHDYSSGIAAMSGSAINQMAHLQRQAWAAGRRAGLEEAAKLVIEGDRQGGRRGWNQAVQFFAERIRAKAGECGGTGRAKP